jgi:hypothetical protein
MAIFNLALGIAARAARLAPEGSALHTLGTGVQAWQRGQAAADLVDGVVGVVTTAGPTAGATQPDTPALEDAAVDLPTAQPDAEPGGLFDIVTGWLTGE